jgi:hypothetical protein
VNADAKMMSEDAEEALVEIESGDTAGGYYTSTIVVFDPSSTVSGDFF